MSDPEKSGEPPSDPRNATPPAHLVGSPPILNSGELLRGAREVLIDHQGSLYRLRLTRTGKLILHK